MNFKTFPYHFIWK